MESHAQPANPLSLGEPTALGRPETGSPPPVTDDSSLPYLCRPWIRKTIYGGFVLLLGFMLWWRFYPTLTDPTFEQHIAEKRVMVGMTREQVLKSWGSPYTMKVTYTDDGLRREEWIYEDWVDASTVKHRYLYFEENILLGGWWQ
ncbi:hypothetical protein YTPLAS18_17780 [Nitrospira sp.]|nr:hypothetical protein YTPLAS18_17780 [Nitrospira sp.]